MGQFDSYNARSDAKQNAPEKDMCAKVDARAFPSKLLTTYPMLFRDVQRNATRSNRARRAQNWRWRCPSLPTILATCLIVLFGFTTRLDQLHAQSTDSIEKPVENTQKWLRGTAETLEMRIQGEVLEPDGAPAIDSTVSVFIVNSSSTEPIEVKRDGHRFEFWLPVHRVHWHAIQISATSNDKQRRANRTAALTEIRQLAINGVKLELQQSTRTVTANLVHNGDPVANANVKIVLYDGTILKRVSDDQGIIKFNLLPNQKLRSFTAWSDKPLIGGYQFSRGPVRDPGASAHTVELFDCRNQTIRVVDHQGNVCPDVIMQLQIATPQPHFNYLGSIEASRMVTNEKGEAVFAWFPDWKNIHCYVDLENDNWVIDGKSQWVDGDFVVHVKPSKARQTARGKLIGKDGSNAGFAVFWRSFQGEREGHSDHITSVTDREGNFSANVLPGATYCVFVNDTKHVSNMVDLIPIPTDGSPKPTATIRLQKAEPLEIIATAGAKNRPLPNQAVSVRQTHRFQWMENNQQEFGSSARDRYVYTGDDGKATAMVESGKDVRVSIYNPGWRIEETIPVIKGDRATITLHREIDEPRTILGIIVQDKQNPIPPEDITVTAGSVDGETQGTEQLALRDNGVFSFKTQAIAVGILAFSKDRSVAGVVVEENPHRLLRLYLQPTKTLRGRLVDPNGKPIAGRTVNAMVHVMLKPEKQKPNRFYGFSPDHQEVQTDADGYYIFNNMPCDVDISVTAEPTSQRSSHWLGITRLKPNEEHSIETETIKD